MNCEKCVNQLSLLLYDELSFGEEEEVHGHLESCTACRAEYESIRLLHRQIGMAEVEVPPELLGDARRSLRVAVAATQAAPDRQSRWRSWLQSLLPPAGWGKPAGAMALVAIGFVGGRLFPDVAGGFIPGVSAKPTVASHVRYVQPEQPGRVQIVVDEVSQRVLEGGVNDENIRDLLLTAARESNDPGVRVETMDVLKDQWSSADVRRAVLSVLQNDRNPGVRLKALEALRGNSNDRETRRVLVQVLLHEGNPGIRTQAIDLLTRDDEPELVGVLQEVMAREDNGYVRQKCQSKLREMNASVETF